MSLVVNTNIASMNAQRSLHASSKELATAMERLSTGKKINSAADDAAGFAIAESMTAQVRGLNMAVKNANDGLSLAAVVENASNDVTDMLQRIRELAVQAVSDTNSRGDRENLHNEARALIDEIDRVASSTQYNGEYVLNGDYRDKEIQVGYNDGDVIKFSVDSISSHHLGENTRHYEYQGQAVSATLVSGDQHTKIVIDAETTSFQVGDRLSIAGWGDFNVIDSGAGGGDRVIGDTAFQEHYGENGTGTGFGEHDGMQTWFTLQHNGDGQNLQVGDEIRFDQHPDPMRRYQVIGVEQTGPGLSEITVGEVTSDEPMGPVIKIFPDNAYATVDHPDAHQAFNDAVNDGRDTPVHEVYGHHKSLHSINLVDNASDALNVVSAAIDQVGKAKAELGAFQNRLEYTVANLMNVAEFTSAARSRIQDADFAQEAANLAKSQVLQQAGAAMLAQANAAPQLALSLLRS